MYKETGPKNICERYENLPTYKKYFFWIFGTTSLIDLGACGTYFFKSFQNENVWMYIYFVPLILILIFIGIEKIEKNQKIISENYKEESLKRLKLLSKIFIKYEMKFSNIDRIRFLISVIENLKKEKNPFFIFSKTIAFNSNFIVGFIMFILQEGLKKELYTQVILILIFFSAFYFILFSLYSIFNLYIFMNYDYLISDLKQAIIFNEKFQELEKIE